MSCGNYVMMSKKGPSWISKFFQNIRKPPKITEKYSKTIKKCKKDLKKVKIHAVALKVIFINNQ